MKNTTHIAVFGGGCFWCTEAIFDALDGVLSVVPGYTGGETKNPTYETVSAGMTGHGEVVKVEYDPEKISYHDLLTVFFATHDPTTLNRQGADVGTQYRSSIFFTTEEQKREAEECIRGLQTSGTDVVTEIKPFEIFYEAEKYHKEYYAKNSANAYCQLVINPKLHILKKRFQALLKQAEEKVKETA